MTVQMNNYTAVVKKIANEKQVNFYYIRYYCCCNDYYCSCYWYINSETIVVLAQSIRSDVSSSKNIA